MRRRTQYDHPNNLALLIDAAQQIGSAARWAGSSRVALATLGNYKAAHQPAPGFTKVIPRIILPHHAPHLPVAADRKTTKTARGRKEEGNNKP